MEDPPADDPPVEGEGSGQTVPISGEMRGLPTFMVGADSSATAIRWKKWKRSFGLYLQGKGIVGETQKKALLLHTAGAAQDGESIDNLACRLRQKASTCDFGNQVDVHIRDQIIEAGLDPKLKRKFLER
ncbi:hypothetical protein Bbelb_049050 [Branchiostoma belcheri]|nr:hypothetical protein Bbelb_049050 [Branchiostoma belcheri]